MRPTLQDIQNFGIVYSRPFGKRQIERSAHFCASNQECRTQTRPTQNVARIQRIERNVGVHLQFSIGPRTADGEAPGRIPQGRGRAVARAA